MSFPRVLGLSSVGAIGVLVACSGPVPPVEVAGAAAGPVAGAGSGAVLLGGLGSGGVYSLMQTGTAAATPSPTPTAMTGKGEASGSGGQVTGVTSSAAGGAYVGTGVGGGKARASAGGGGGLGEGGSGAGRAETCNDGIQSSLPGGETDVDCGGATCGACPGALLLSEVAISPTLGEYIEIVNPSEVVVSLDHVYLADYPAYFQISADLGAPHSSDFRVAFPAGAQIAAKSRVVVALKSATEFFQVYGRYPDYDFSVADNLAPTMLGAFSSVSGLSDGDEMVVLFRYVPHADRVSDLDYVVYGNTSDAVDKTSSALMPTPYAADTPISAQRAVVAPKSGQALVRCGEAEDGERKTGGNGYLGHDETSEALDQTWRALTGATPQAPAVGCPEPLGAGGAGVQYPWQNAF